LILGAKASHCIPGKSVLVGEITPSIYLDTAVAVIILVAISNLERNFNAFPVCSSALNYTKCLALSAGDNLKA
jgi:hypothetical protein